MNALLSTCINIHANQNKEKRKEKMQINTLISTCINIHAYQNKEKRKEKKRKALPYSQCRYQQHEPRTEKNAAMV
jgi:endonuclease/exonuclease/phosphatase family metal-dependent hydrolase